MKLPYVRRPKEPWHPPTCGSLCAVLHCQDRCGRVASHGSRLCYDCRIKRRLREPTTQTDGGEKP